MGFDSDRRLDVNFEVSVQRTDLVSLWFINS